ncbi:MAG: hypothetical protein JSR76_02370 [Verrucomicrobia bacterium]|nr:hypothetical protein [Verrucomicrobiota bacterium]
MGIPPLAIAPRDPWFHKSDIFRKVLSYADPEAFNLLTASNQRARYLACMTPELILRLPPVRSINDLISSIYRFFATPEIGAYGIVRHSELTAEQRAPIEAIKALIKQLVKTHTPRAALEEAERTLFEYLGEIDIEAIPFIVRHLIEEEQQEAFSLRMVEYFPNSVTTPALYLKTRKGLTDFFDLLGRVPLPMNHNRTGLSADLAFRAAELEFFTEARRFYAATNIPWLQDTGAKIMASIEAPYNREVEALMALPTAEDAI